jgi:Rrf2 family nitric oxide-sensitive transcriptional repressor
VRLTEAGAVPAECFDAERNTCVITPACELRHVLAEAVDAFHTTLSKYTLADLVRHPRALGRILTAPRNGDTVVLRRMDPPRRRGRA